MNLTELGYIMDEVTDNAGDLAQLHRNCSGWRWDADARSQTKIVPIEYPTSLAYVEDLVARARISRGAGGHDLRCTIRLAEASTTVEVMIVPRKEV